ncbi:MAG: hypothetical protein L7W95_07445 [Alphaproteobacteria bacterium]|jgi:hypothetical protein|nr:hypothetical protein [SAR116 cluster bacterium]MCH1483677.1 hypothetical protein [Alphaproteobacteria bacterium]
MSYTATLKRDSRVTFVDYTWIISGILYQGGTDALVPELMSRGINEVYFHNVAGTPIGKKTVSGVADSFDVEEFFVVVSADQAENIFDFIFHFCELDKPNIGMIRLNKLSHSTIHMLPDERVEDNEASKD